MRIIITDLTRFKNQNTLCTAGVTSDGTVIRPMPYLTAEYCQKSNIHPGGILAGDFTLSDKPPPHIEDATYSQFTFQGACSKAEFREALLSTLYANIAEGFGVPIQDGEKCIPQTTPPVRSLITIKPCRESFAIVRDSFDRKRLKAHFTDQAGTELRFVSITDRGFYDYAQQRQPLYHQLTIPGIQRFIRRQSEVYLRLGLSRLFGAPDGRRGYWIQLNGIYTFPDKLDRVRCYD